MMLSYGNIAGVLEAIGAFGAREAVERVFDTLPSGVGGSFCRDCQEMPWFGEDLLARIQVWTVWLQEQEVGADGSNGLSNGCVLVVGEIVHHDRVVRGRRRNGEVSDGAFVNGS